MIALSSMSSSHGNRQADKDDFCSTLGLQKSNTGNGKCYKILPEKVGYDAAKKACSDLGQGVDLASFCDEGDVETIGSFARGILSTQSLFKFYKAFALNRK